MATSDDPTGNEGAQAWLLVDCAHEGEVRIAFATPGPRPVLSRVHRYGADIPTFTDVLLRFERESGLSLRTLEPVVAVAGVPGEKSTIMERSRWVVSRDGLDGVFGRPVVILNEVAAQAWALQRSLQGVTAYRGSSQPSLSRRSRYAFVTYEEGVGTAIIDVDDHGRWTVLDAEGGQLDFAPLSEDERTLMQSIPVRPGTMVTWEQVLMERRKHSSNDAAQARLFAQLLGRFVSNLIYTAGAWNGVFLTGRLVPHVSDAITAFDLGLWHQRQYHRVLSKAGCWRVAQTEAVLNGCLAMLAARSPKF